MPEGTGFTSRAGVLLSALMKHSSFPPLTPDERAILLKSEEQQPFLDAGLPIRIVFLPGHTADSVGLYLEETRELLCGDAAGDLDRGCPRLCALLGQDHRAQPKPHLSEPREPVRREGFGEVPQPIG